MIICHLNLKVFFLVTSVILAISSICLTNDGLTSCKKRMVLPYEIDDNQYDYVFVHILRGQECTKCSVEGLYQWNSIIRMIGRKEISYLFVIETLEEDTPSVIQEALARRPFSQPMFVDYNHSFLEENKWLTSRRYSETNDFLIDMAGRVVSAGDPMSDMSYLKHLNGI